MSNLAIGDKLALSGKVLELKLGKSFDSGVNQNNPSFHTFRYDFKPASVDASQMARVDVEQRNQVSVTLPHHDSTASTVFKGSQRPYHKECVLIIDHKSGEVTLERLSCNVQLKKTRAEGSSKVSLAVAPAPPSSSAPNTTALSQGRPVTPSSTTVQSSQSQHSQSNHDLDSVNSKIKRPSPPAAPGQRSHTLSPAQLTSAKQRISPIASNGQRSQQPSQQSTLAKTLPCGSLRASTASIAANSMPLLLDDSGRFDDSGLNLTQPSQISTQQNSGGNSGRPSSSTQPSMPTLFQDSNTDVVAMSEGSSSSSSSSDSSSDGSASDSESDVTHNTKRFSATSGSPAPAFPPHASSTAIGATSHNKESSMPKLSQLSEDLQLSESGSDSE